MTSRTRAFWRARYRRASRAMDVLIDVTEWRAVQWSWKQPMHWNARHIAASLLLDGAPIEALP